MRRHGPMVWGVCRRVLPNHHDAEEAFQATFLVLVRKAASLGQRELVGNWLYGTAYRAALEAKAARRRVKERQVSAMPEPEAAKEADVCPDLRPLLDRELDRLPDKYRAAIVLCDLEGGTRREVARRLGIPEGTLSGRLTTARRMLAKRLARHGLTLSGAALTAFLSQGAAPASVPASLVSSTIKVATGVAAGRAAATGLISAQVAALTEGVMKTMLLTKLKTATVVLLLLGFAGFGASQFAHPRPASHEAEADKDAAQPKTPASKGPEADKVQADVREMRGTWTTTVTERRTVNSEPQPPRQKKVTYVISDNKLFILGDDGLIDQEWTFRLDATQKPKAIDLVDPRVGAFSGIYELKGNTLKIALAGVGKRPTEFPAKAELYWNLKRVSRVPAKTVSRLANAPGCFWMVEPTTPPTSMATSGIVFVYEKDRDGAAFITLASALAGNRRPEYRPVLLDAGGKRYLPETAPGGGYSRKSDGIIASLTRWRMDPKVLPAEKVSRIGIEGMTSEYHRIAARAALERARKEGIEVLPIAEIGKPFDFVLTTTDGKKVRGRDLRGKVVLIDCWATWCSPCMALMPELKELYEQSRKDGLEIVGVSFDQDAAKFKKTCAKLELPWPQVIVPHDEKTRQLWQEVTGIGSIPRLFLIDREGVLRADTPSKLKEEVTRLLKAPQR